FFSSSRRRHTSFSRDWSSDVCSSDLILLGPTVTVSDPTPLNEEQTAFRVHAEAVVRTVSTAEQQQELIDQVTGKSIEEAEEALEIGRASCRERGWGWVAAGEASNET